MLISEVSRHTGLTKKAIEYYTLQELVSPVILDNGYRDYSGEDVELLNKVCVLRKLDMGIDEIRAILADRTGNALHLAAVRKELELQRHEKKKEILEKLENGRPYSEVSAELHAMEEGKTITEKLLDAFPGYYGRFICLHFAGFLNEPVRTRQQQRAFKTIITFLDNIPAFQLPHDLENYLLENTKHMGIKQMGELIENTKKSVEDMDGFLTNNKETLKWYLAYRQSEEYKNSPIRKIMDLMKEFYNTSGYYDVFLPAVRQLSNSYSEYCRQLETANKKLLEEYPEIEQIT